MVLCSIYLVVAPFADYPLESTYCTIFILSGVPLYFAFVKYKILPRSWMKKISKSFPSGTKGVKRSSRGSLAFLFKKRRLPNIKKGRKPRDEIESLIDVK